MIFTMNKEKNTSNIEKTPHFCIVCGREFEPTNANGKYCSAACRAVGQKMRRRTWETKTDYREKKRVQEQERRNRIKSEANAERAAAAEVKDRDRKKRDAIRRQQRENTIRKAAASGDPLARMAIESMKSGNKSPEYWAAFADYEQQYAAQFGKKTATMVNGILVTDPDFPRLVVESIERDGIIRTQSAYERIITK